MPDKELLLRDLCARLPYGVKVQYNDEIYDIDYVSAQYEEVKLDFADNYNVGISEIKPYLRPMSSMTKEERNEFDEYTFEVISFFGQAVEAGQLTDWLNARHFDYRGLIPMGLALEAPENMYKN